MDGVPSGLVKTTMYRKLIFPPVQAKKQWPLQMGFDRFYGFIGGETNQWYPDLVEDNHYIEQPYSPEEGYHLSKDLADQAIKMISDQKSANPSKPWFMWYCPVQIMHRIRHRRNTLPNTKENLMMVMMLTVNGYFRE